VKQTILILFLFFNLSVTAQNQTAQIKQQSAKEQKQTNKAKQNLNNQKFNKMSELSNKERVLLGLGASGNQELSKAAPKLETGASKDRMQVLERIHQLPKEIQDQLMDGRMQISDKVLYSAISTGDVDGGKLVKTDKGTKVGQTNISQGKYGYHFLLLGVQILFDSSAIDGLFQEDLPKEIFNGNLNISANNKSLFDIPVRRIATVNGYPVDREFNTLMLNNPKWFEASTDIQAVLEAVGTLPAGFISISFIGAEIRPY